MKPEDAAKLWDETTIRNDSTRGEPPQATRQPVIINLKPVRFGPTPKVEAYLDMNECVYR
jgi:hypothetical protein